jgi:hypothetical protein
MACATAAQPGRKQRQAYERDLRNGVEPPEVSALGVGITRVQGEICEIDRAPNARGSEKQQNERMHTREASKNAQREEADYQWC